MMLKREVERLYWEQEKTYNIVDQGDYAPFYEHLKTIFLKIIKNECGNMIPDFTKNFMKRLAKETKKKCYEEMADTLTKKLLPKAVVA